MNAIMTAQTAQEYASAVDAFWKIQPSASGLIAGVRVETGVGHKKGGQSDRDRDRDREETMLMKERHYFRSCGPCLPPWFTLIAASIARSLTTPPNKLKMSETQAWARQGKLYLHPAFAGFVQAAAEKHTSTHAEEDVGLKSAHACAVDLSQARNGPYDSGFLKYAVSTPGDFELIRSSLASFAMLEWIRESEYTLAHQMPVAFCNGICVADVVVCAKLSDSTRKQVPVLLLAPLHVQLALEQPTLMLVLHCALPALLDRRVLMD